MKYLFRMHVNNLKAYNRYSLALYAFKKVKFSVHLNSLLKDTAC